ncbi:hypothetical protein Ddye_026841 [Dipteronia dyeriana]|uniref:Disease resistance protein At4g27190-like leucine-rich repeats domain-containing protein n=1 Tax=Dipteronia dyeriana TaxID=168575 RepID=A0AAD9WPX5_9ROSI|nr:hypothetical protein Ddye_026841 [Dipteronia dyeriana]
MFSPSLARNLLQLEELIIQDCGELEQIIVSSCWELEHIVSIKAEKNVGGGGGNDVILLKLRIIVLFKLKNFINFYSENLSLNVQTTKRLKELKVRKCDSLEHIIEITEAEENVGGGGGNDAMFPKLRILQLDELENFINFYSENSSLNMLTAKGQLRNFNLLRHGLQNLEESKIVWCRTQVLFQLEGLEQELSLPSLKVLELKYLKELIFLCEGLTHLLNLPNLNILRVENCNRLRHMFSPSLARNLLQLEELAISWCGELEQILDEDNAETYNQTLLKDHLQSPLLFPNLSRIEIWNCGQLKSMFPVSIGHLLSLQNLTNLRLCYCDGLTHLFSSTTLVRNLLRLEELIIRNCGELEQIIVEDHTEDDHVQLGLFPNLSSISVNGCGKLKTLFPFNITQLGLQKLRTISVEKSFQLEELFGHKDEADMTSHREMVLPQLQQLSLEQLASLVNFCPVGYHFIFPSLSWLVVIECPKLTTRFSIDKNRSVHAEAKAPQTAKEDVDMELSPPKTTRDIKCWDYDSLRKRLPPYIGI